MDRQNNTLSASYTRLSRPRGSTKLRGGFNRQQLLTHSNTTVTSFLSSIGFERSMTLHAYANRDGSLCVPTMGHPAVSFSNTFATLTMAAGILIVHRIKS